ncbi:MAG: hypothetical protein GY798_09585 [Hyphomicrobiales bacterium]|nr:hypothetical protein [Hyphomicrobiales bacterium]
MWGFVFAVILVGIPAAAGGSQLVRGRNARGIAIGATLVAYAVAVAVFYILFLPEGRLLPAQFSLIMPLVLAISLLGGFVAGAIQRKRNKDPSR